MPNSFQIEFPATEMDARNSICAVVAHLAQSGVVASDLGTIEIALAEAVNNVVEHAAGDGARGQVDLSCQIGNGTLSVVIRDAGRAMPDLQVPASHKADLSVDRASLPEGGFGWFLIHQLARSITYQRSDGTNRLELCFDLCTSGT